MKGRGRPLLYVSPACFPSFRMSCISFLPAARSCDEIIGLGMGAGLDGHEEPRDRKR